MKRRGRSWLHRTTAVCHERESDVSTTRAEHRNYSRHMRMASSPSPSSSPSCSGSLKLIMLVPALAHHHEHNLKHPL